MIISKASLSLKKCLFGYAVISAEARELPAILFSLYTFFTSNKNSVLLQ
jgi:hypothetical protein